MPLPRIAIIGRPNVGKSSLLNRIARRRVSIVDSTPGVTRDRVGVVVEIDPPVETPKNTPAHPAEITDTGGYGIYTADGARFDDVGADLSTLTGDIERQITAAMNEADMVLFVIDAQSGLTALDERIARLLREQGRSDKVIPVANKVDGDNWVPHGLEQSALGFGEPFCVAAGNGRGIRLLLDELWSRLHVMVRDDDQGDDPVLKIALVGKRNAGKSTMINALAGEPRVIVSEIAGTTRDAVDVRFEIDGRTMIAIDTAGVRKRKSINDRIEVYAYDRMIEAVTRADVVLFLIDASQDISHVDKKLSKELQRQYKPTVLVVTKTDLIDKDRVTPEDYLKYITQELRGLDYCPVVFVSAEDAAALKDAVALAWNLYEQASHRVGTGELNETVAEILQRRGPSSRLGTQAKLYFASQIEINPPTIVLKVNKPELFEGRYERYLLNRLREELPYSEVPIKLIFSPRDRMDLEQMKQRGKQRDRSKPHATRAASDDG